MTTEVGSGPLGGWAGCGEIRAIGRPGDLTTDLATDMATDMATDPATDLKYAGPATGLNGDCRASTQVITVLCRQQRFGGLYV